MALTAERALHCRSDSANLVRTFHAWQSGRLNLDSRPWSLRPNGDLWAFVQDLASQRGPPEVTRLSKVRAHLDRSEVQAGRISLQD
eukprot:5761817-Alexandrium_andersonii.AAC.1